MTLTEIDELIEQSQTLKQISQAYSEIAHLKITKIRAEVERNRQFFEEIFSVYSLVKKLAIQKRMILPKPKKRVYLIITSNFRFYGKINSQLIDFFITSTSSQDMDRIMLGKAAIDFFRTAKMFTNYQEVLLQNDQPTKVELNNLVNLIKDYNQVLVFYFKLKSLLVQEPAVTDITASTVIPALYQVRVDFRFIFEPELPKILTFFDNQILTLLLEQTFLESEVARTASRFVTMDQAETAADKLIKGYENLRAATQRNINNNQLLEAIATARKVGGI